LLPNLLGIFELQQDFFASLAGFFATVLLWQIAAYPILIKAMTQIIFL
jgi:hypothetical protein